MGEKFIIDLDESTYSFVNQTLNTEPDDFSAIKGCKILFTDFANTCVSGGMNVDADIKYAEVMVARKLQDDGNFDEPVSIITHWKRKTGKNSTEIFFSAVPSKIYLQYLEEINEHEDLLIVLPVFTVLFDFAKQIPHKNPIAVVFRHDRFADFVIVRKTRLYYAARSVAFETSEEQISELWKSIEHEIVSVSEEKSIKIEKIISLNWIDTVRDEPFCDNFKTDCFIFNEEPVVADDNIYNISFTKALKMCHPSKGITSHSGKFLYYSGKLYSSVIVIFTVLIFAMSYGYFSYHLRADTLKRNILSTQQAIHTMRNTVASAIPVKQDYLSTVKFVDAIFYIRNLPSYRKIINDISSGLYPSTKINDLKIDYTGRTMQASITGAIDAGFDTAYKDYEMFLSNLTGDGYSIDKSSFNTEIQSSEFNLTFTWSLK